MVNRVSGPVLLAMALLLVTAGATAECTKDTDCKGDRVCDAGACTAPAAAPAGSENGWGTPAADATPNPAGPSATADAVAHPADANAAGSPPARPSTDAAAQANLLEPVMRPKSVPLVVLGVVALSASAFTFYGAYALANVALLCDIHDHSRSECRDYGKVAIGLGVATVALIGVGLPMTVIGAKRVPAKEQPKSALRRLNGPEAALLPFVTPDSAGMRFQLSL